MKPNKSDLTLMQCITDAAQIKKKNVLKEHV